MLIPEDRQQDVLDMLWLLLRAVENNTYTAKFYQIDVECGYRLMRDLGVTTAYPYWIKKGEN